MNTGIKIILSVVVFLVGSLLMALTKEMSSSGNPIGFFIICPVTFIAIGAIWKYNSKNKQI